MTAKPPFSLNRPLCGRARLRDAAVKVSKDQINKSVLILKTTDAVATRTDVIVHIGLVAVKAQVVTVAAIDRTRPVEAVAACVADSTIVVVAVTCHNKL